MMFRNRFSLIFRSASHFSSLLLFSLVVTGCTIATTRPLDPTTGKAIIGDEDQKFNAVNLAAQMWETQVFPALEQGATPIDPLLAALRADTKAASEKYGRRPGAEQPYSFMVTGQGKILTINTESRAGSASVDTTNDGQTDMMLAIGPVIRGTALRDALPFINFNQFTNQMDYAAVSNQLNILINEKVLSPLGDVHGLEGKSVSFSGAFTIGTDLTASNVVVSPAMLKVTP